MKVFVVLSVLVVAAFSQCGTPTTRCSAPCSISDSDVGSPYASLVVGHEGCCSCAYIDSTGHPTIGVGYLLTPSRSSELSSVGANYNSIVSGGEELNTQQISQLFGNHLSTAVSAAQSIFPNFNSLGGNAQKALVDMAYNLGQGGLNQFTGLKNAITSGNYAGAAAAAQDSLWCKQVKTRCTDVMNLLQNGASGSDNEASDSDNQSNTDQSDFPDKSDNTDGTSDESDYNPSSEWSSDDENNEFAF